MSIFIQYWHQQKKHFLRRKSWDLKKILYCDIKHSQYKLASIIERRVSINGMNSIWFKFSVPHNPAIKSSVFTVELHTLPATPLYAYTPSPTLIHSSFQFVTFCLNIGNKILACPKIALPIAKVKEWAQLLVFAERKCQCTYWDYSLSNNL